ncbi:MAG: polysaccharide biosynthesis C-terminal domain-containing protein, partial [Halobacteriaceae archaeon]
VAITGFTPVLNTRNATASNQVGQYRSIQPVTNTVILFLQVLTFIYLPIATRHFEESNLSNLDILYKTSTRWIAHATFPLALFYLLFGKQFITVFFGSEYSGASIALTILTIGMYSRVIAGPNGMTIKAIDRTRIDLLASLGALVTNVVLNIILIPKYGLAGAASATMAGYFVYNTIDLIIIYKYVKVSPFHLDLFKPFVPTILICVTITQIVSIPSTAFHHLVLIGIGISAIHLLSILLTTGLTDEDQILIDNLKTRIE